MDNPTPAPIPPAPAPVPAPAAAPDLSAFIIASIRTAVPVAVGSFLTFCANRWDWFPRIDGQSITPAVVFVVSYGYYALVRQLERWKPSLGWLLGYPAQPHYH